MNPEIFRKVAVLIGEKADGVSVHNSELFDTLWKEKGEFSKYLLYRYTQLLEATGKGGYFRDNFHALAEELVHREEKPLESKKTKQGEPSLNDELFYHLMQVYLSADYEPPTDNATLLQLHLCCIWICYNFVMPNMDKVYPQINMKLDSVLAKLAFQTGLFVSGFYYEGWRSDARKDAVKPAIGGKKLKAKNRTDAISEDLLKKIASETDRKKKADLLEEARKKADLTDTRAVKNRVKNLKK